MATLDSQRGDVAVVIAAGGAGLRLGSGVPKALRRLAGEPLLVHAVRRVSAASSVGWIVVAAPPGYESAVGELLSPAAGAGAGSGGGTGGAGIVSGAGSTVSGRAPAGGDSERPAGSGWSGRITVVAGGAHRHESVAAALAAVPDEFGVVLVHDAARALAPSWLVEDVAAAVRAGLDAVIPVLPVTDTISQVDPTGQVIGNPDRSALRAVQTPQGFRRAVLAAAYAAAPPSAGPAVPPPAVPAPTAPVPAGPTAPPVTDDAGLVARLGVPVHTVPGSPYAMKITTVYDLAVADALLASGLPGAP